MTIKTGTTGITGMIVKRVMLMVEWQVGQLVHGVVNYAHSHNWHLILWHAGDVRGALRNWRGDGIIASLLYPNLFTRKNLIQQDTKLVSLVPLKYPSIPYTLVREDDDAIGRLAAEYFIKCGYMHFGVYSTSPRGKSFSETLKERGFNKCFRLSTNTPEKLPQWLVRLPKPCAVFAENDWDASDVINTALLSNIGIPSELSVLGVGNDTCVCHAPAISLSSIDSRLYQLGWSAAEELDRLIDGGEANPLGTFIPPAPIPIERESMDLVVRSEPRIREIIDYMKLHLSQKLPIHSLALRFGLSDSALYKLFAAQFNASPKQILLELRLKQADYMLRTGSYTIKQVAEGAGFPTLPAFFEVFKEKYGCTPGQWKKSLSHLLTMQEDKK